MKKRQNSFWFSVGVAVIAFQPAFAATPEMWLQSSGISGAGNTITVTRVPVRNAAGKILYKNITIRFLVDGNGNPKLASGSPIVKPAPDLILYTFIAGTYRRSDGCKYTVSGPGALLSGRTSWSITKSPHSTCDDTFNASWTTGPIKGHPNQAGLENAGVTNSGYSWGTLGGNDWGGFWFAGAILGAQQSGNQLTLHNFPDVNSEETNVVFTLCPGNPASC